MVLCDKHPAICVRLCQESGVAWVRGTFGGIDDIVPILTERAHGRGHHIGVSEQPHYSAATASPSASVFSAKRAP